jgi:DNA-binding HxlR family transcriptional regulator
VPDPRRRLMAAESLTSHLRKLEREGRVTRETSAAGVEAWRLAE